MAPPKRADADADDLPAAALAGKLYRKVVPGLSLSLSTLLYAIIARSIHSPSSTRFLFGWPGSELGHVFMILQMWGLWRTHRAYPRLLFSTTIGRVCALVATWSTYKFAVSTVENFAHRDEFKIALLEQGGIIQQAGSSRVLQLLSLVPLFIVARRAKSIKRIKDIEYSSLKEVDPDLTRRLERTPRLVKLASVISYRGDYDRWHALDVISSDPPPPKGAPCLLYIHGGAWIVGDKQFMAYTLLQRIASRGIVIFTINYRMAPESPFPAAIVDCKRALSWVKRNAHQYNGDPDKIFVSGESAGGHLAALVCTTANFAPFQPPEDKLFDSSVMGGIPLCGVYEMSPQAGMNLLYPPPLSGLRSTFMPFMEKVVMQDSLKVNPDLFKHASPLFHVQQMLDLAQPDLCPLMVVHGTLDVLTCIDDAKRFFEVVKRLREKHKSPAKDIFVELTNAHHAPGYFPSMRSLSLADGMVDFIFFHANKRAGTALL